MSYDTILPFYAVLADYSVYQRFDNFNSKYSPFRLAQLRKIFLKVDNCMDGRSVHFVDFLYLEDLETDAHKTTRALMKDTLLS